MGRLCHQRGYPILFYCQFSENLNLPAHPYKKLLLKVNRNEVAPILCGVTSFLCGGGSKPVLRGYKPMQRDSISMSNTRDWTNNAQEWSHSA